MDISIHDLCRTLPSAFALLLSHARSLSFEEEPDYAYLRNLFYEVLNRGGFEDDGVFDWNIKADHDNMSALHEKGLTRRGQDAICNDL